MIQIADPVFVDIITELKNRAGWCKMVKFRDGEILTKMMPLSVAHCDQGMIGLSSLTQAHPLP